MNSLSKKLFLLWVTGIFLLGFFLRFYAVANTPHDLYIDEVAIGWNAYSILKTGHDEHGIFMPFFFKSFGDYKLPIYVYATSLVMSVLGKTALAVRLPAVIGGSLSLLAFVRLLVICKVNRRIILLSGALLAISPWHLHFTRAGFEAGLAILFLLLALGDLMSWGYTGKHFLRGIFWTILYLYTYHAARLVAPFYLLAILLLFRERIFTTFFPKPFHRLKPLIKPSTILFLSALILVLIPYANYNLSFRGWVRVKSEFFIKDMPKELEGDMVKSSAWKIQSLGEYYFRLFSLNYLFFVGDTNGRHSVRDMGELYLWQLPLLIIGFSALLKEKILTRKVKIFFLTFLLYSPIAAIITTPNPHAIRSIQMVIPWTLFSAVGVHFVIKNVPLSKIKSSILLSLVIGYFFAYYLNVYYIHYPKRTSPDWYGGYKQAMEYVRDHQQKYAHVYLTNKFTKGYIFLYFYGDFDPKEVQQAKSREKSFGKFEFIDTINHFSVLEKIMYVGEPGDPFIGKELLTVKNAADDPQFVIWEN